MSRVTRREPPQSYVAPSFTETVIKYASPGSYKPKPAFTTQPSISPTSGVAGTTVFTANDGTATNTTTYARRWLLSGAVIGTGTTVTPGSAGTLVLEVTATGAGGSVVATSSSVTVDAAPVVPTVYTPSSTTPGLPSEQSATYPLAAS